MQQHLSVLLVVILCLSAVQGQQCPGGSTCPNNLCCSQYDWCGNSNDHCGAGCKSGPCHSNGLCGGIQCPSGQCCSQYNYCGNGNDYCGAGCKSGPCWPSTTGAGTTSASSTTGSNPGGWPNGPVKAIYVDIGINWADPANTFRSIVDAGYNLLILAFLVSNGNSLNHVDAAAAWDQMGSGGQQATINYAHARNARIIISAGGSTDFPYNSMTGSAYGTAAGNWANARFLDGVDFDLENFGPGFTAGSLNTAATITWVVQASNSARNVVGASKIVAHAPQPPYFGNSAGFNNGYGQVYQQAPHINFFFVQYYNNGPAYTYNEIFVNANGGAVSQINALGVPLWKIVVGKPVTTSDIPPGGTGYIPASTIASIFTQAQSNLGWNTGVMGWQWRSAAINQPWINTIY